MADKGAVFAFPKCAATLLIASLCLAIGQGYVCQAAQGQATLPPRSADMDAQIKRVKASTRTAPLFQAVQQTDPDAIHRYLEVMSAEIKAGKTQSELDHVTAEFFRLFLETRLLTATPETLMKVLTLRLQLYQAVASVSKDALYAMLVTDDVGVGSLPPQTQTALLQKQQDLFLKSVLTLRSPPAEKPVPQDEPQAKARLEKIVNNLPTVERNAYTQARKTREDKMLYCRAYVHLFNIALKLPSAEAIPVFRELAELPSPSGPNSDTPLAPEPH